jgi:hypothetical protein
MLNSSALPFVVDTSNVTEVPGAPSILSTWCMEHGVRSMEHGVWSMEYAVWSMEYGVCSMEHSMEHSVQCEIAFQIREQEAEQTYRFANASYT